MSKRKIVGVLPDGKHFLFETKRPAEAICAECAECGAEFDNNVTFFRSIAQKTWFHERGTRHRRFIYYAIDLLTEAEQAA